MKDILTYTIIAGSRACPNNCRVCISKMTPDNGIGYDLPEVNWRVFDRATQVALNHNAKYALITSKGESTLYPAQISTYLIRLQGLPFDRRELQTEGSQLMTSPLYDEFLDVWRELGLDTVAVSIYHWDSEKNKEVFRPTSGRYLNLTSLIGKLHSKDLNVRLSCLMLDGYIDSVEEVKQLVEFAKQNEVFQLTLRRADRPAKLDSAAAGIEIASEIADYVDRHRLSDEKFQEIAGFLEENGTLCDMLPHGANVYELEGQNVCITTGLTQDAGRAEIRQLIFFPPRTLTTSWENVRGGRIL